MLFPDDYTDLEYKQIKARAWLRRLTALALFAVLVLAVTCALTVPVVEFSTKTGQCVQVHHATYTCDTLPRRYEKVWVR